MATKFNWTVLTDKALVKHVQGLQLIQYSDWPRKDWGSYSEALRRKKQRKIAKAAGVKVGGYRGKRRIFPDTAPVTAEPLKKAA